MIGRFVASKAGHDKDTLYVVVAEDGDCVMLCDGRLKKTDAPKRKKKKHIQPTNRTVDEGLIQKIQNGQASDEEIKYAIKHYSD